MSGNGPFKQLLFRYRQGLLAVFLLFVSSMFIFFNGTPGVIQPKQIGLTMFSALQSLVSSAASAVSGGLSSVSDLVDAKAKYEAAEKRLIALSGLEREVIALRDENKQLREQLDFKVSSPFEIITVKIIAKDPSKVFSSFTVNKGYLDGIRKDFPVVAYQNGILGLVGKIQEVGLSSSIVQPILDGNMFVAARFLNSRFEGLVSGKGNNEEALRMAYVEKRAKNEIQLNDLVVTSGLDSLYPPGISIGRVRAISSKEYETSLEVELEPVVSFSQLEFADVIKSSP